MVVMALVLYYYLKWSCIVVSLVVSVGEVLVVLVLGE